MGLVLPLAALPVAAIGQSVPLAAPYEIAWTQAFDAALPVRVSVAGPVAIVAGPDTPVVARALATGDVQWTADATAAYPPMAGDGLLFVPSGPRLIAIDLVSGVTRWTATLGADAAATPAWIAGGLVVPTVAGLEAFRTDGTPVWTRDLAGIRSGPIIANGAIFVGLEASVVALTLADGTERWRHALPGTPGAMAVSGERLYFGVSDGSWVAYPLDGGRRLWRDDTRVPVIGRPMPADSLVLVAFFDNTLRAFDAHSANLRWFAPLDVRPGGPPRLVEREGEGEVVIPAENGDLLVLALNDSTHRARHVFSMPEDVTSPGLEDMAVADDGTLVVVLVSSLDDPGFRLVALRRPAPVER